MLSCLDYLVIVISDFVFWIYGSDLHAKHIAKPKRQFRIKVLVMRHHYCAIAKDSEE